MILAPFGFIKSSGAAAYTWTNTEGQTWYNQVIARGGTVSNAECARRDDGLTYLKGTGDFAELDCLYIFRDNSIASRTCMKNPSRTMMEEVNSPSFSSANGYSFNGTNQYLKSKYNPAVDGVKFAARDNCMIGVSRKNSTQAFAVDVGCSDGTNACFLETDTAGGTIFWICDYSAGYESDFNRGDGNYFVKRNGGNEYMRLNGYDSSRARSNGGVPNAEMYIGAHNNNGTASGYRAVTNRFFVAGSGSVNLTNLDSAMNTYFLA